VIEEALDDTRHTRRIDAHVETVRREPSKLRVRAVTCEHRNGAEALGELEARTAEIDDRDSRRTAVASELCENEPDRPAAEDYDEVAEPDPNPLDAVHSARNRLDECGDGRAHVADFVSVGRGYDDVLGKAAIARDADCVEREAVVVALPSAEVTGTAIDVRVDRDARTDRDAAYVRSDRRDRSGELVTRHDWITSGVLASKNVNIRTAHSRAFDPQQQFVRSRLGLRDVTNLEGVARDEYSCLHPIASSVSFAEFVVDPSPGSHSDHSTLHMKLAGLFFILLAPPRNNSSTNEVPPHSEGVAMSQDSNPTRIVVKVDAELEDLVPGFLENRRGDVKKLTEALATGDFDTMRVLGHSMKGSGGGYGFDAITDYGRTIENAARAMDVVTIERTVLELADYLDRVDVVYVW
jgi:HPt (histidine-containing phosphotransfer) domain-containing protein